MATPFTVLEKDLIRSNAFRSLAKHGTAIIILMDFMLKRQMENGGTKKAPSWYIANNGKITYCFSEAEKKGITRPAFCRNRDILIERGFIDIVHNGCGGRKGDKTLYAISFRWKALLSHKFTAGPTGCFVRQISIEGV